MEQTKVRSIFLYSTGIVFLLTGAAKLIAAASEQPILAQADQVVTFITNRQLLLAGATAEACLGGFVLLAADTRLKELLIGALTLCFVIYRVTWWVLGAKGYCFCLGYVWKWFDLSPSGVDMILKVLILYLVSGCVWLGLGATKRKQLHAEADRLSGG